jgi:hypothetical protein
LEVVKRKLSFDRFEVTCLFLGIVLNSGSPDLPYLLDLLLQLDLDAHCLFSELKVLFVAGYQNPSL